MKKKKCFKPKPFVYNLPLTPKDFLHSHTFHNMANASSWLPSLWIKNRLSHESVLFILARSMGWNTSIESVFTWKHECSLLNKVKWKCLITRSTDHFTIYFIEFFSKRLSQSGNTLYRNFHIVIAYKNNYTVTLINLKQILIIDKSWFRQFKLLLLP